jgi:protein-disulfide isomerase
MNSRAVLASVAAFILGIGATALAVNTGYWPAPRAGIEAVIRNYLINNPEVLQEAFQQLEKRQTEAQAVQHQEAVKENASMIFDSEHQVVLGNPKGDVTLVEFFDYNCGFCKRAMSDMTTLLKEDSNLRVVLKEFPVLGPGSDQAAQVAVAARMQDTDGQKYLAFHQELLGGRGQADGERALAAAKDAGFDMERLQKDIPSPEVRNSLDEVRKLGETLGISGTPSYVLGNEVVVGAVGLDALKAKINVVRCGKAMC